MLSDSSSADWELLERLIEYPSMCTESPPAQVLFGCNDIRINPYVLRWFGVDIELNFTPIHSNTCGLR
jgi:hypothetical protein